MAVVFCFVFVNNFAAKIPMEYQRVWALKKCQKRFSVTSTNFNDNLCKTNSDLKKWMNHF